MANPGMPLLILEQHRRHEGRRPSGREGRLGGQGRRHRSQVEVTSIDRRRVRGARWTKVILTANPGSRTYDIEATLDNTDPRLQERHVRPRERAGGTSPGRAGSRRRPSSGADS